MLRICSCASDAKGSVGLAALPKASCVCDPDWYGHCGVGDSITDPRSVPDQGGVIPTEMAIAGSVVLSLTHAVFRTREVK